MSLYVQYGCGFSAPDGWLNFDASPTLRFERLPLIGALYTRNAQRFPKRVRYGNIVRGLPVEPNSVDGMYCSHVLEHLSLNDCGRALRNTFSYMKPGAIFRLVVPDMEKLARDYVASGDVHRLMRDSCLGAEERASAVRAIFGNSSHLWMWDEPAMREQLRTAGFRNIRRARFNDSADARFREVEDAARFDGCLAMECAK
ncbi:MAG: class I SAM-dependent methyltransferase [Usitatibacter sp.]